MDKTLLFLINRAWTNPALDALMATVTNFSVFLPFIVAGAALLLWRGGFRERSFVVATACILASTDGVFTQFMKKWAHRPRPHEALAGIREVRLQKANPAALAVFEPVHVEFSTAPDPSPRGRSFPSGHAMNNAVVATTAVRFFRRWGWWYSPAAALVAYSRVYCGSHWPSDVLTSAVLGVVFACVLLHGFALIYQAAAPRFFPRFHSNHPRLIPASCG
ncbi:MAG TPA: phosphatase PAP2 family protein [Chthoniobacterales bacterium]